MDKQELQNQIALHYSKLPPESQRVFSSMEWLQNLRTLSQKYNLTEEKIQVLGTETTLVLLGIIPVGEYESTLKKDLGLSPEFADKMLSEINESILNKIRLELKETFEKNSNYPGEEKLDERFNNLSEKTRNAIMETGYYRNLYGIGEVYKLNVTQLGDLEEITTSVITGALHPDKFEKTAREKLQLPEDKSKELVKSVNEEILRKIREKLVEGTRKTPPTTLVKLDMPELEMPKQEEEILNQAEIKIAPRKESPIISSPNIPLVVKEATPLPKTSSLLDQKTSRPFPNAES